MTVRHPLTEAILGLFLLGSGVVFFVATVHDALAVGVLLFIIFGGFGVLLLVMAAARWRWLRAYWQLHGHSPFTML
jgi:uncharacterized membrane protein YidH (DUF202 family)